MTDTKLKPCPFCYGSSLHIAAYVVETPKDDVFWFLVECENPNCRAEGPWDLGKSGAVDKWNERASDNNGDAYLQTEDTP